MAMIPNGDGSIRGPSQAPEKVEIVRDQFTGLFSILFDGKHECFTSSMEWAGQWIQREVSYRSRFPRRAE